MKLRATFVVGILLCPASAYADHLIDIQTDSHRYTFTSCDVTEMHLSRHSSMITVIADCKPGGITAGTIRGFPYNHEDGHTLGFQSRVLLPSGSFLQCELLNYTITPSGSFQQWQCLDE